MAKEPLTTGIAYRLGWGIYWVCLALGVLWVGVTYFTVAGWPNLIVFGGLGALLFYGLGRFFRYVLSDE